MTRELVFATYLAPNIRPVYELVAGRVGEVLGVPSRLVTGRSFSELTEGSVDFAFVCGLPYVRLSGEGVRAIAAPVVRGDRYGGRPVYFSDVIVPTAGSAQSFDDLRGCVWAYNEPNSHSGCLVTLHRLLEMGETAGFFGRWAMTGFHQESVRSVAAGKVDASAIDSQVLAVELRDHPELAELVRVIGVLGPSTIQPLVAAPSVPDSLRRDVQAAVCAIGAAEGERAGLAAGLVDRYVPIADADYADIRAMLSAVEAAGLSPKRTFGAKSTESTSRRPTQK